MSFSLRTAFLPVTSDANTMQLCKGDLFDVCFDDRSITGLVIGRVYLCQAFLGGEPKRPI